METQDQKKRAIKLFHVLLMQCGIDSIGKEGLLSAYGVESSKDLTVYQLNELICRLRQERPQQAMPTIKCDLTAERRRCKVAVGKYLALKGDIKKDGWGINEWHRIIQVACRAAKVADFNLMPKSKLRAITYEFNKQREAMENAREFINNSIIY